MDSPDRYEYWGSGCNHTHDICRLGCSGVLPLSSRENLGQEHIRIMTSFIPPIAFFIVILSIGVICGGISYVIAYRSKT